ncbi:MAG: hypothetical protein ABUL44_03895, partial [Flavobacterium sp.]
PLATWPHGVNVSSCLMPAFSNADLLVTIPAGMTVTHFYVKSSYYARNGATRNDGRMYFSTGCGRSPSKIDSNYTIPLPDGLTSGEAQFPWMALDSLALCFTPSCSTQSFDVTMHLGRTQYGSGCDTYYIL